LCSFI
jgi:hypothetical protein